MKIIRQNLIIDFIAIVAIISLSLIPIIYFNLKFLWVSLLLFGLPSIYLLLRKTRSLHRILVASLSGGIIFTFIFDFLAVLNNAWSWDTTQFVFPFKVLGVVSIDEIIWLFFWVLFILVFYEHFIEHERSEKISQNFKYAAIPLITIFLAVIGLYGFMPQLFQFGYSYFVLCLITLPFLIYVSFKNGELIGKFFRVALFFIPLYFIVEMIALGHNQWYFHGQYIGIVSLFGYVFPFEELFFWILMSSTIVLSYYETFIDDEK